MCGAVPAGDPQEKYKILLIHDFYRQSGGEKEAVLAQKKLLEDHGHHVCFYYRHNTELDDYSLFQKIIFFPEAYYSRQTVREIRKIVAGFKPDIAHVHNVFPLISPSVYDALNRLGVPMVQTIHNFRLMCPNGLFYRQGQVCELCKSGNMWPAVRFRCFHDDLLLSALYGFIVSRHRKIGTFEKIDRFILLNEFVKGKFLEVGIAPDEKLSILGNFIDMDGYHQEPIPESEGYFVFIGRITREKGIFTLLEAVGKKPEIKLKILGTGPSAAEAKKLVINNGWKNIELLGWITGEEKQVLLKNAVALVFPSAGYEHFPMTLLEAFSLATPVIASDLGGIKEIVKNGVTGLLFAPGDVSDLGDKISYLASDPDLRQRLSQNIVLCRKQFNSQNHYDSLMLIYSELL